MKKIDLYPFSSSEVVVIAQALTIDSGYSKGAADYQRLLLITRAFFRFERELSAVRSASVASRDVARYYAMLKVELQNYMLVSPPFSGGYSTPVEPDAC